MNALFAQTAFAVHSTQTRVADLAEQHDVLATDVARLSSPSRIAAWAERYQMVLPDNVVILRVPGSDASASEAHEGFGRGDVSSRCSRSCCWRSAASRLA